MWRGSPRSQARVARLARVISPATVAPLGPGAPVAATDVARSRPSVLFVGAFPAMTRAAVRGGQLSLCKGILASGVADDYDLVLFDSTQKSIPPPRLHERCVLACLRVARFIELLVVRREIRAVVVMAGPGASALEKGGMVMLARAFRKGTAFYQVALQFFDDARRSRFWRAVATAIVRTSDVLVCLGPSITRSFVTELGALPSQCIVLPNLVDSRAWEKPPAQAQRSGILFIGWIEDFKGVFDLLDAISSSPVLREQRVEICGGGRAVDAMRNRIVSEDLTNVHLPGWVEDAELHDKLTKAAIFVLPSYSEGFSVAVIEALAAGCAIVTTDVGVHPDYLVPGENALLVPAGDPAALAAALEQLVLDQSLLLSLQKEGEALFRSTFDAGLAAAPLRAVIEAALDASSVPRAPRRVRGGAG